jgi:hypothetical protein
MLNNTYFYNASIRKTLEIFGVLFSNIIIKRNVGIPNSTELKVPIVYSPRDRLIARAQQVPDLEQPIVAFTYPAMGFEMTDLRYDPSRKLNNVQKIRNCSIDNAISSFLPVPYNLTIELNIIAVNSTDILQIIEQILPYFTPTLSVSANMSDFGSPASPVNIPFTLDNVSFNDTYLDNFQDDTREITYTLRFTAQTYIFGAVQDNSGQVIRQVFVNVNEGLNNYTNAVTNTGVIGDGIWSF